MTEMNVTTQSRLALKDVFTFVVDHPHIKVVNTISEEQVVLLSNVLQSLSEEDSAAISDILGKFDGLSDMKWILEQLPTQVRSAIVKLLIDFGDRFFDTVSTAQQIRTARLKQFIRRHVNRQYFHYFERPYKVYTKLALAFQHGAVIIVGGGRLATLLSDELRTFGFAGEVIQVCESDAHMSGERKSTELPKAEIDSIRYAGTVDEALVMAQSAVDMNYKIVGVLAMDDYPENYIRRARDCFSKLDVTWTTISVDPEQLRIGPTVVYDSQFADDTDAELYPPVSKQDAAVVPSHYYGLAVNIFLSDLIYMMLGNENDGLISDLSLTLERQFVVDMVGLRGYTREI